LKFLRKRSTIVLAAIGAAGAIAALATAASFALFYDPPHTVSQTFTTGSVEVGTPHSYNCVANASNPSTDVTPSTVVAPGYSTIGYPDHLGDQKGTDCTFEITYQGTMDAYLATDVSVISSGGSDTTACGGGEPGTCDPLYSPYNGTQSQQGLEVWTTYTVNGDTNSVYALGIGPDQTLSQPGTTDVDTVNPPADSSVFASCQKTGTSAGKNCPVTQGFEVTYQVFVYWALQNSEDQNAYQNSSATVNLTLHAVQAYDNPLHSCRAITDPSQGDVNWTYTRPDQPLAGWGMGFDFTTSGLGNSCPSLDQEAGDWTTATTSQLATTLYPFFHPDAAP